MRSLHLPGRWSMKKYTEKRNLSLSGPNGCDGCINVDNPFNAGPMLDFYNNTLMKLYDDNGYSADFSRADFLALAGIVAIRVAWQNNEAVCGDLFPESCSPRVKLKMSITALHNFSSSSLAPYKIPLRPPRLPYCTFHNRRQQRQVPGRGVQPQVRYIVD